MGWPYPQRVWRDPQRDSSAGGREAAASYNNDNHRHRFPEATDHLSTSCRFVGLLRVEL